MLPNSFTNLKKEILIKVSAEDIEDGIPRSPFSCMISRAVKRNLGVTRPISIPSRSKDVPAVCQITKDCIYALSNAVNKKMLDFDNNRPVEPFSFKLLRKKRSR